jgi:hypothetical protein
MTIQTHSARTEGACTRCGMCPVCQRSRLKREAPENELVRWYVSNKGFNRGCNGPESIHECWGCGYRLGDAAWTKLHGQEYDERLKRRLDSERRMAEYNAARRAAREAEAAAREAALRPIREAQEAQRAREAARGPIERAVRSAGNQVKELALWLLFFMLLGIASRGA